MRGLIIGLGIAASCVAVYFWVHRLTPEERFLVGEWRGVSYLPDGSQGPVHWNFLSNHQVYSQGCWWEWKLRNRRLSICEILPSIPQRIWDWQINGISFRWRDTPFQAQLEVLGPNSARISIQNATPTQRQSFVLIQRAK